MKKIISFIILSIFVIFSIFFFTGLNVDATSTEVAFGIVTNPAEDTQTEVNISFQTNQTVLQVKLYYTLKTLIIINNNNK